MIKVDQEKCIGCGLCAGNSPENFVINSNGKAEAISQTVNALAKEAAKDCPVGAISVK
ncbi:ferredoxin [Candidatus Falkowbacteria bacterium]|nr:ferredoxin [Candidatus Falkowbacteria bacterium]NCT54533.1 ferredoxin [Candidatus Falkowbacteria bacterium]